MQRIINLRCQIIMRKYFITAMIFALACMSCSKQTVQNNVLLRVENTISLMIDSVVVSNPSGTQVYYNINSNAKSGYKAFDYIYNYAYIKVYTGASSITLQPIDYVGEPAVKTGKYTYRLYTIGNLTTTSLRVENNKD